MILFTKTRSLEYIDAYNHIERHLTQLSKRSEIKTKGKVQILPTLFRPAFPLMLSGILLRLLRHTAECWNQGKH